MKNLRRFFSIFLTLFFSSQLEAQKSSTAELDQPQAPQQARITCNSSSQELPYSCSLNPDLEMALAKDSRLSIPSLGETGIGESVQQGIAAGKATNLTLAQIRKKCNEAAQTCLRLCADKGRHHLQQAQQAQQAQNPGLAQAEQQKAMKAKENAQACRTENQQIQAKAKTAQMNILQTMATLAAIANQLGLQLGGGKKGPKSGDSHEDECEGPMAQYMIQCTGPSEPKGTRAGLSGKRGSLGQAGSQLGGLASSNPGAELGGGDAFDSNFASNPSAGFNRGGVGGFGGAFQRGGSGGSLGSTGPQGSNRGDGFGGAFQGVGSFGGSGGGGSSGGGFGRGGFGTSSYKPPKGFQRASLNRKLKQVSAAAKGSRNPASKRGMNGAFEDNWTVIRKAYKRNTPSLLQQR